MECKSYFAQKHFCPGHSLMEKNDLQLRLFRKIKEKLVQNISLADELADILQISNDSAYRRIRGEKELSLPEAEKLCAHFRISLDQLMNIESAGIIFSGKPVDPVTFSFVQYLEELVMQLTIIRKYNGVIYYEAKDILPFHHYQFPELADFKYFFWMKTILNYPEFHKKCFEDFVTEDRIREAGNQIISVYSEISSVEIWNAENLYSSIRQIEFCTQSGIIKNKTTADNLYRQLAMLLNHLEEQAVTGQKFVYGNSPAAQKNNFQLFCNETFFGHNTLLVEIQGKTRAFLNYGVLNYLETEDEKFCKYIKNSMENTMHKSSLISSVNEKERSRFFGKLHRQIEYSANGKGN